MTILLVAIAYIVGAICGMLIEKVLTVGIAIERVNTICTNIDLEEKIRPIHIKVEDIWLHQPASANRNKNVARALSLGRWDIESTDTPQSPKRDVDDM